MQTILNKPMDANPPKRSRLVVRRILNGVFLWALSFPFASATPGDTANDPHYTEVGMFDVHYCHWSDRPNFFKILFSTEKYTQIEKIETFFPNGMPLGRMDLSRYKLLHRRHKPAKRVFIIDVPAGDDAQSGWYTVRVAMKDGAIYKAKDFVYIISMGLAKNVVPANGSNNIAVPKRFSWDPVPGAKYYKVFVWDLWGDGAPIFDSGLLKNAHVDLPDGLIKPNGWYRWSIHARDVNEHVLLGDFNHGSNLVGLQFMTGGK